MDHECLRVYLILTTSPIFNLKLINSNFDLILEPFTRFCQQFISCHLRVRQVVGELKAVLLLVMMALYMAAI